MAACLHSTCWVPDRAVPLARAVPSGMRVEECSKRPASPYLIPDRAAVGGTAPGSSHCLDIAYPRTAS